MITPTLMVIDVEDEGDDFFECHGEWRSKKRCAAIVTSSSFYEPANLTDGEMMRKGNV
ncbi:unnamed protein product [Onchocerca flexuosa]|uniref:Uncharacterized protein n=1 Tax=Onchocerca flexuosa TaxID=387005 RepID=A0A183I7C9_9BILA|nr:unnamed protein product [Onchocerca flexuosa]